MVYKFQFCSGNIMGYDWEKSNALLNRKLYSKIVMQNE